MNITPSPTQVNISIIGACTSRDIFGIAETLPNVASRYKYTVDRFIQNMNPVSAVSAPIDSDIAEKMIAEATASSAPNFYKRLLKLEVEKTWYDYFSEVKSDWLILDMSAVRTSVIPIGSKYITYVIAAEIMKYLDHSKADSIFSYIKTLGTISLATMDQSFLTEIYKSFFDKLLQLYPVDRIIVVDVKNAYTFIDTNKTSLQSPNYLANDDYSNANARISFAYNFAKEYLHNAHFVNSLPTIAGKINHKWGIHGLHYVDDVYAYFYKCIDNIIHLNNASNTKQLESLYSLQLQKHYSEKIFSLYQSVAMASVEKLRNILPLESGVTPGEYTKNGITLVISSTYEFSITGTATEDTCFFLYSYSKNPLGNWRSVPMPISSGKYIFSTRIASSPNRLLLQLVLANSLNDMKWINGHLSTRFTLEKPYSLVLIRAIIKKDVCLNENGCITLEQL